MKKEKIKGRGRDLAETEEWKTERRHCEGGMGRQ